MNNKKISNATLDSESSYSDESSGLISNIEKGFQGIENLVSSNFDIAHHCYILLWIFISSFFIYVIGNRNGIKYVDLLFFCCSACTQTGLSTVDVKDLTFFQQIILYFCCTFTTPIFIHGSSVFIRLYWYEKEFKDIESTSIYQYNMRRTNTIAQLRADLSRANTGYANENSFYQEYGSHNASQDLSFRIQKLNDGSCDNDTYPEHSHDIKFGDLPKPQKRTTQYTDETSDRIFSFDSDIEGENDEDEEELNLMKSISGQDSLMGGKIRGRFNIFKRKLELRKKILNQNIGLDNSFKSAVASNKCRHSLLGDSNSYGSVNVGDAESLNLIDNSRSFKRSHTTVTDTLRRIKDNVLKRSLTTFSRRYYNMDPSIMDDESLLDYATRNHGEHPVWGINGRNSNLIPLTKQQKEELGGVEYQAMKLLAKIVFCYYFGILMFATLCLATIIRVRENFGKVLEEDGCSKPLWWAIFTVSSAFANEGFTLNASSFKIFDRDVSILTIFTFIMLAGNTMFPINLRIMVWLLRLFTKSSSMAYDSLTFLLEHPRRCFTLMFPSSATWWLLAVLICMNFSDWLLFALLDIRREALNYLPTWYMGIDGLFQAVCTRTTGFNVFQLADLNHAIQLSYVVMMYVSALPLAISIRSTNVYEDQSLEIYKIDEETSYTKPKLEYVAAHIRKQLSHDIWFIFCAVFIICVVEGKRLDAQDVNFDIFRIIFEVVSAYGTVGLTLGYPAITVSFCGKFHVISKLVIMVAMIRGRHRDLPNPIDRSIILPGRKLAQIDDLENEIDLQRINTNISRGSTVGYI